MSVASNINGVASATPVGVSLGGTGIATAAANGIVYGNTTSPLGVTAAGTTGQYLTAVTSGAPVWSSRPYFVVRLTSPLSNVTGDNTNYTVLFDTVSSDSASGYNTGTGLYTVPATGVWLFGFTIASSGWTTQTLIDMGFNMSGTYTQMQCWASQAAGVITSGNFAASCSYMTNKSSGNTVGVFLQGNGVTKTVSIGNSGASGNDYTLFWGHQVG